jgi:2-phospho-L-lactate transferase/gluconeogenesis factor (CofD/UPF0052 family)
VQKYKKSRIWHAHGNASARTPARARGAALCRHHCLYGIGSLFTSFVAGLIPHGIGEAVRGNHEASKVLVLNGHNDRETGGFCARLRDHDMMNANF